MFLHKPLIILILLCQGLLAYSQKQTNIWYFGDRAGVDFNTEPPTPLSNSALFTREGVASIANVDGQLLFYSNGINVWNKNHQIMWNGYGLMGDISSTSSAFIVQKPGSASIYYLFTTDAYENNLARGLRYSIVDMSLRSGLGEVTEKNILLNSSSTEKLTAIYKGRCPQIWLIGHEAGNNVYIAYQISETGVNHQPVRSATGVVLTLGNALGQMKISPDGRKLAMACSHDSPLLQLCDFDVETGVVSNPKLIDDQSGLYWYGLEFSPDSRVLYTSCTDPSLSGPCGFYQFHNLDGDVNAINQTKVLVLESQSPRNSAMQLASNGKIYFGAVETRILGAINKPNLIGAAAEATSNAIYLLNGMLWFGLPSSMQSYFVPCFTFSLNSPVSICQGQEVLITAPVVDATYTWNDGSQEPHYLVTAPGKYWVTINKDCCSYSDTVVITRQGCPVAVMMPNVFTPNHDGINDVFVPIEWEGIEHAELSIVSRWGSQVFRTNNVITGWDGYRDGERMNSGLYFWHLTYTDVHGRNGIYRGYIELLW